MIRRVLQSLFLPLCFCSVVLGLGLIINAFQYDTDEGLNLIKSLLVLRGHRLYTEIWSDQPPVFTCLLTGWFKLTGVSVTSARVLVLLFSFLLLWSLKQTLELLEDKRHAWVATLLLAGSTWYARLSFSVMIGLPALSLAMLSVWLLAEYRKRSGLLLAAVSGALLAVSLQTKVFTALLVPMMVILSIAPLNQRMPAMQWRKRVAGLAIWAVACVAMFAAISHLANVDFEQLTTTHVVASGLVEGWGTPQALVLLRRDWHLVILVGASALLLRRDGIWRRLLPFVWLAVAATGLQIHRPIWRHHSLLVTIPAAWAAAEAVLMLWRHADFAWARSAPAAELAPDRPGRSTWARLAIGGLTCWLAFATLRAFGRLRDAEPTDAAISLPVIEANAPQTRWIYSDRLMVPFRAALSVPPALAVISVKRQQAGQLTDDLILETLARYRPEQIAIGRLDYGPDILKFISENYTEIWKGSHQTIYLADLTPVKPH